MYRKNRSMCSYFSQLGKQDLYDAKIVISLSGKQVFQIIKELIF